MNFLKVVENYLINNNRLLTSNITKHVKEGKIEEAYKFVKKSCKEILSRRKLLNEAYYDKVFN